MSDTIGSLLNLAGNARMGIWALGLQPASWRGVPFHVRQATIRRGRRGVVHEYPFRDDVWVEDLGRGTRSYTFAGFLIGDDVFEQRDAMVAAAEAPGVGELVHPSLGTIRASLPDGAFSAGERADLGRVVEIEFTLIEAAAGPTTPTDSFNTQLAVSIRALQSGVAMARQFVGKITTAIAGVNAAVTFGENLLGSVVGIGSLFCAHGVRGAFDGGVAINALNGLPGNFGRYSLDGLTALPPADATVQSLLSGVTTARTAVAAAQATVAASGSYAALADNVLAMTEAVRAVAPNPASQIRVLSDLASFTAPIAAGAAPVGIAIAAGQTATVALCQQAALISLARALADYRPSSYDDAAARILSAITLFDAGIVAAADADDGEAYASLRSLRTAVISDLTTRGAQLPRVATFKRARPLPSLVLAYSLYGDASRSDDLISRVNPTHPSFMPVSFKALSA